MFVRASLLSLLLSGTAGAQIVRAPGASSDPRYYLSAGLGLLSVADVRDGRTQSRWAFSEGLQYRGSAEVAIGRGSSVGAVVTYARLPLTYLTDDQTNPCSPRCEARATMWSVAGAFHAGGGVGLHQVIDATIGVASFTDFRADGGAKAGLPPAGGDRDFLFTVGYGFGWGLSPGLSLSLVQEFGATLHQRDGLPGGQSSMTQQRVFRLTVRAGGGARSRF